MHAPVPGITVYVDSTMKTSQAVGAIKKKFNLIDSDLSWIRDYDFSKLLIQWPADWSGDPGASQTEIEAAEQSLAVQFPLEYRELLMRWNGGEASFGTNYIAFWPANEVVQFNRDFKISHYLGAKVIGIGTNGGGICIGLDYRNTNAWPPLISVPLGDLDIHAVRELGASFEDGLMSLISGQVDVD